MSIEKCTVSEQAAIDEERAAVIERAITTARHNRDTPVNCGFGYDIEENGSRSLLITHGGAVAVAGSNMPPTVSLEDIERVSTIQPVPYCGDERPYIHVRRRIDPFMRDLPA